MHQFLKNIIFVIAVGAGFIGIPFGLSEIFVNNSVLGGIITSVATLIVVLSFKVAAYYHNQEMHITDVGLLGALFVFIAGNCAIIALSWVGAVTFLLTFFILEVGVIIILILISYALSKRH